MNVKADKQEGVFMDLKSLTKKQSGFTIVEVVLVLAIAALIFLIVFLAVPQLRRARRDTQRQSDLGRLGAALEQYAASNNGAYPAVLNATFVNNYLDGKFNDPLEDAYVGAISFVYTNGSGVTCPPSVDSLLTPDNTSTSTAATTAGARRWAAQMNLEGATYICQSSE